MSNADEMLDVVELDRIEVAEQRPLKALPEERQAHQIEAAALVIVGVLAWRIGVVALVDARNLVRLKFG